MPASASPLPPKKAVIADQSAFWPAAGGGWAVGGPGAGAAPGAAGTAVSGGEPATAAGGAAGGAALVAFASIVDPESLYFLAFAMRARMSSLAAVLDAGA